MTLIIPSYQNGFAPRDGLPENPGLRTGVVSEWDMYLGPTGLIVYDQSGFHRDGTLTAMDPATDWVTSRYGWALDLDGNDDHIALPTFYLNTSGSFSIVIRCRSHSFAGTDNTLLAAVAGDTNFLFDFNDTDSIRMRTVGAPTSVEWAVNTNDYLNIWRTIVLTHWLIPGIRYELFTDGVSHGIANPGDVSTAAYTGFRIGLRGNDAAPFDGEISTVQVYDRVLATSEIQYLYRDPHALTRLQRRVYAAAVAAAPSVAELMAWEHPQTVLHNPLPPVAVPY